jgi:hypothetical protein
LFWRAQPRARAGSRFGGWRTRSGGGKRIWRLGAQRRWIKLRPRGLDSFWSRRVEGAHLPELHRQTTRLHSTCPPPSSPTASRAHTALLRDKLVLLCRVMNSCSFIPFPAPPSASGHLPPSPALHPDSSSIPCGSKVVHFESLTESEWLVASSPLATSLIIYLFELPSV